MMLKVCIDPGHAESTAGKSSFDRTLREYEFNRAVAIRLREQLERHEVSCIYSCDIDAEKDTSLASRASRANDWGADIFISIHANAFGSTWNDAEGWEAYVWKKGGQAQLLAQDIQRESIPYLGLKDRGVKTANFAVLRLTDMPAVLVEHGFYTNQREVELLKSPLFREQCALADAKGILRYAGISWQQEDDWQEVAIREVCLRFGLDLGYWLAKKNDPATVGEMFGVLNKINR